LEPPPLSLQPKTQGTMNNSSSLCESPAAHPPPRPVAPSHCSQLSYASFEVVTWHSRRWAAGAGSSRVAGGLSGSLGAVTWHRRAALSGSLGAVTWRQWAAISGSLGAVTWHHWAGSLASLGAGDVASLDGFVGGVERRWLCRQAGPSVAQIWAFTGAARRRQWRPRVVDGGGSGEKRWDGHNM